MLPRQRILCALGAASVLCIAVSCEDDLVVSSPPVVLPPVPPSIQWSIDAKAEPFATVEEALGTAVAVGESGTYQFDGSNWERVGDGLNGHDYSLAADGSHFALSGRSLYRRDGTAWANVRTFSFDSEYASIPAVWAYDESRVFVITSEEVETGGAYWINNTLHRQEGSSWRAIQSFGYTSGITDMWGSSPNSVYIACTNGLFHFDGTSVSSVPEAGDLALRRIYGTSSTDVFAIRADGTILRFDGSVFSTLPGPGPQQLNSIRRLGGDLFACGNEGTCYRYAGGAWQSLSTGSIDPLTGVWATSHDELFAFGAGGMFKRTDGLWRRIRGGAPVYLTDVWVADSGEVFIVGDKGVIEIRDADGWRPSGLAGFRSTLAGISGTSRGNVYAVGAGGSILHYDGNAWAPMASGTSVALTAVWANENTAVAVGGTTILKLDNGEWSPMSGQIPQRLNLTDVWGASEADLFAVGYFTFEYRGAILHNDGSGWRQVDAEARPRMFGVWGFSRDEVFVVGEAFPQDGPTRYWAGAIYRYDGATWTRMFVNEDISSLNSLWGSGNRLIAVGSPGLALYNGATWRSEFPEGFDGRALQAISAAEGTDAFGIGGSVVVRFQFPE